MDTPVYEEHQPLRWLSFLLALAMLAAVIGVWQSGARRIEDLLGFAVMVVVCVVAVWGFSRMTTVVTATELRFGFPLWHKRLLLSAVQAGAIVPLNFWHGIGIHYTGATWIYNARLGRAVEIRHGGTRYLIGSREPERLQSTLLQNSAPRVRP